MFATTVLPIVHRLWSLQPAKSWIRRRLDLCAQRSFVSVETLGPRCFDKRPLFEQYGSFCGWIHANTIKLLACHCIPTRWPARWESATKCTPRPCYTVAAAAAAFVMDGYCSVLLDWQCYTGFLYTVSWCNDAWCIMERRKRMDRLSCVFQQKLKWRRVSGRVVRVSQRQPHPRESILLAVIYRRLCCMACDMNTTLRY
jgi:hypothetical protein